MAEKARGVKFFTRVGLLSGQAFSPFDEDWFAGSHGGGITLRDVCGHSANFTAPDGRRVGEALGIAGGGVA